MPDERIEKAAIAVFAAQTNWADPNPSEEQIQALWDIQMDAVRDSFRRLAQAALDSQEDQPADLDWENAEPKDLDSRTVKAVTKDGTIVRGRTVALARVNRPAHHRRHPATAAHATAGRTLAACKRVEKSGFLRQNKGAVIVKHILLGFIAVLSLMLVPLILMHKGKGGGFSNFAESLTGSAGSSGVAEKNLNRWTVVAAVVWFALIIAYGILVKLS